MISSKALLSTLALSALSLRFANPNEFVSLAFSPLSKAVLRTVPVAAQVAIAFLVAQTVIEVFKNISKRQSDSELLQTKFLSYSLITALTLGSFCYIPAITALGITNFLTCAVTFGCSVVYNISQAAKEIKVGLNAN